MRLKKIDCVICDGDAGYRVKYPQQINEQVDVDFTARKPPRHSHFRIVECLTCGLVYSSPIFPEEKIIELYRESDFLDEIQLQNMVQDYVENFKKAIDIFGQPDRLLEIGCGNGFFLRELENKYGISEIVGVEPGKAAVAKAAPELRARIINDVFHEGLFDQEYFDMVCIFQIMDHVVDPNRFLGNIYRVLRKGGLLLSINHNVRSWFPKLFGRKCPMFDIEHIYLFDLSTMRKILQKHHFNPLVVNNIRSGYCLRYAVKMLPFPALMKEYLLSFIKMSRSLDDFRFRASAGNMLAIAKKA
jgi:SAM-dependent methyltransferase